METKKNEVSQRITYYRKKRGLTQKQLADCLGVSNTTVSGWETGTNAISLDMFDRISKTLSIPSEKLFGWSIKTGTKNDFIFWNFDNTFPPGNYYMQIKVLISGLTNHLPILCFKTTVNDEDFFEIMKTNICLSEYEIAPKDRYGFAVIKSDVIEITPELCRHRLEGKILTYDELHNGDNVKLIIKEIAWINADTEKPERLLDPDDIMAWPRRTTNGTFKKDIPDEDDDYYNPDGSGLVLSSHEKELVAAYRGHPEMHIAVDTLLEIRHDI